MDPSAERLPATSSSTEVAEANLLRRAARILAGAQTLEDLLPDLFEVLGSEQGWTFASIWLVDEDAQLLRPAHGWAARGASGATAARMAESRHTFRMGEGLPGAAWSTGRALWVEDVLQDPRYRRLDEAAAAGLQSAAFVPIRVGDRVTGVLETYRRERIPRDDAVLANLESFGEILGHLLGRIRVEQALRESDELTRRLLEGSRDAVVSVDTAGRIVGWNARAEELFGWTRTEVTGQSVFELMPPGVREEHAAGMQRYAETGGPPISGSRSEIPMAHRDGRMLQLEVMVVPSGTGPETIFHAVARDLTAERELAARTEALAAISKESPSPILRVEADGTVLYVNDAGRSLAPRHRVATGLRPAVAAALRSGQRGELEWKAGSEVYAITIVPFPTAGYANLYGVRITERHNAEADLRRSEASIRTLYEITSETRLPMLAKIGRLLDLTAVRFGMGTGVVSRIVPEGFEVLAARAFDGRIKPGMILPFEETFSATVVRTGEVLAVPQVAGTSWTRHPVKLRFGLNAYVGVPMFVGGELEGVVSFSSPTARAEPFRPADIEFLRLIARWIGSELERDRIGRELEAANRGLESAAVHARELASQADEANRAKSDFLATMSHELRTPLHGIIGTLEVLSQDARESDSFRIDLVRSSADRLLRLVDEVLDFSKIEARRVDLEEIVFDPRQLIGDVVELQAPRARPKALHLGWRVDPAVPRQLVGDPSKIGQVLTNLVGNAIKFTEHGQVLVEMHREAAAETAARPDTLGCGTVYVISVSDTGPGMDPDRLDQIWEPFRQLDTSTTRSHGGTGLGLPIARRLVELLGGELTVSSYPGKGSAFTVRLPMTDALETPVLACPASREQPRTADAPVEPAPAAREPGARLRVLLVEDDPVSAHVAASMLEPLDVEMTVVVDGIEGLERISEGPWDCVFLDCHLPGMDGFSIAEAWREREADAALGHTPIIALSADVSEANRRRCLKAGMDAVLGKPFHGAELRRLLLELAAAPSQGLPGRAGPPGLGDPHLPALLNEALRLGGSERLLELLDLFCENGNNLVGQSVAALRSGDAVAAGGFAHTLRGSVGAFEEHVVDDLLQRIGQVADPAAPSAVGEDRRKLARELELAWRDVVERLAVVRERYAVVVPTGTGGIA